MKRCKSRSNSTLDVSQCMDIERCQEELLKARIKYNKLNQNYLELKVEYNKLEKDYKYNVKIMESIIKESNIAALSEFLEGPKIYNTNNENNNNEMLNQNSLSKTTIKILKEKSIYERLKLEIMNLRDELKIKENTIEDLKNSIKTSKFRELDNKFAQTFKELSAVKARNEVLETMQVDYVNSKNQIIFLLKQIDLYKKENKKQKELYEKLLFDYQNIVKEREEYLNIKNLNDEKIKTLLNKNQNLKLKIDDLKNKNLAYYEEIEKYRNINQGQVDKIVLRKEKEINQYRGQIAQLKMEIGNLQKRAEERNKNNINSATSTGMKKIKPIFANKININKELRKTDSDFFVTKPKSIFGNDNKKSNNEKIVINSKDSTLNNNEAHQIKKISKIKIKDNPDNNQSIKGESKNEMSDFINKNNYYEKVPKNFIIKGGKNKNENKKTTAYEEDINMELKKDEEEALAQYENELKDDVEKSIEDNNNKSKELNNDDNNQKENDNEINNNNDINITDNQNEEKVIKNEEEEKKDKENIENINENKNEIIQEEGKGKYKEDEIAMNMSNEKEEKEENSNKESKKNKRNESTDEYNDFHSNLEGKSSLKETNNNNLKGINKVTNEENNELNESNKIKENENTKKNKINESITQDKNEFKESINFIDEKKDDKKSEENNNEDEEYKFSSRNEGLDEENL